MVVIVLCARGLLTAMALGMGAALGWVGRWGRRLVVGVGAVGSALDGGAQLAVGLPLVP